MRYIFTLFILVLCCTLRGAEPFAWRLLPARDGVTVEVTVAPGHYFYDNTLSITVTGADGKTLAPTLRAAKTLFKDEFAGDTAIYPAGVHKWQFTGLPPFKADISYQGCRKGSDNAPAVCFMPQDITLNSELPLERLAGKTAVLTLPLDKFETVSVRSGMMNEAEFLQFLQQKASGTASAPARGMAALLLLTLLGGILLNFTPCVLPMIPINLAIIGAKNSGRATGFRRGLCYGAGMAVAYGILGLAVVLAGARFGELNSQSWFNFVIAAIFIVLSCSMFGWFNLDFNRFSPAVRSKISGSQEVVAFGLGTVSALLAGACVAPVVIGTLLAAAQFYQAGHIAALGLPFLLGVGMGLPWPFAGAGLSVLPKPGKFMVYIKYAFGVIILAAGIWYLFTGWSLLPGKYDAQKEFIRLEDALKRAEADGKPVLIDFWATWCKNCKAMEKSVFTKPEVKRELARFEVVKFQAEKPNDPAVSALLKKWDIAGLPAFVILKKAD